MTALNDQFNELVKVTLAEKPVLTENDKDKRTNRGYARISKKHNFFQGKTSSTNKPSRNYTTTRIKSRNFLSNISYVGINEEDS